jgi:hypothetical protein
MADPSRPRQSPESHSATRGFLLSPLRNTMNPNEITARLERLRALRDGFLADYQA